MTTESEVAKRAPRIDIQDNSDVEFSNDNNENPSGIRKLGKWLLGTKLGRTTTALTAGAVITTGALIAVDSSRSSTETTPHTGTGLVVPEVAKNFVKNYGSEFKDPVSTYYAEQSYTKETGRGSNLDPSYIKSYVFDNEIHSEQSQLGFTVVEFPLTVPVTAENTVTLFNSTSVEGCINIYMNAISKNPSEDAIKVIDNEFNKYCGRGNAGSQALLDTLKTVVNKYGSTADYKVTAATLNQNDTTHSIIGPNTPLIDNADPNTQESLAFHTPLKLVFEIDTFKGDVKTSVVDSLPSLEMSIIRVPATGPADPGVVGIGIYQQ